MISLPFDSAVSEYDEQGYPIYDRASNSEELRTMLSKNFTDGVYPNPSTQFQVSTGTDMTVTVNPGACNIQGAFAYETNNRVLIVQAADTTYDRIDRVVLRLNTNTSYRNIDLYVIEGTPASTPVAPELSRTSGIWDIGLANLFIAKNTTSISASRITDTRLDNDVCGVVSGTIQSVDTSTIFAQYQAALDEYLELVERAINDTEAGYLQDQINDVSTAVAPLIYKGVVHNTIYRGKNLGTSVTAEQYAAISAGTFEDLYIGDYWTIDGVNYRIAAFDYYWNCSDDVAPPHHAVIVPDKCLYNYVMNDTNTTAGGYVGSKMYTEGLEQAKTTIKAAFSGHVVSHRIYLTNAVSNGYASGGVWCDSEVDLMNEQMVYGSGIFSPVSIGSAVPINQRVEKNQLPLFAMNPAMLNAREIYWMRDVITNSNFARIERDGRAFHASASLSRGVRPAFCIS